MQKAVQNNVQDMDTTSPLAAALPTRLTGG
jgi:hypothetical protein